MDMEEEIDYESLLAPVHPSERKQFIMDAVMGMVIKPEQYKELQEKLYRKGYNKGYNDAMKGSEYER